MRSSNDSVPPGGWRSLAIVLGVQSQNAFNDNLARFSLLAVALIVLKGIEVDVPAFGPIPLAENYKYLAAFLLSLPFILLAPFAGWMADRFSKRHVIQACLWAQIAILLAISGAVYLQNIWLATFGFFLLAIQSAFFSPAKMGILKELVGGSKLSVASGWMQMLTIVAIIFGQIGAGKGFESLRAAQWEPWNAALLPMGVITILAFVPPLVCLAVTHTPARSVEPLRASVFVQHFRDLLYLRRQKELFSTALGILFFWFAGGYMQLLVLQVAEESVAKDSVTAYAAMAGGAMAIGIAVGSFAVACLSWKRIELGLVPLGSSVMALCLFVTASVKTVAEGANSPSLVFLLLLFVLGAASACFLVPLNAHLQDRADPKRRGRVLAASGLLSAVATLSATVGSLLLETRGVPTWIQFVILGTLAVLVSVFVMMKMPANLITFVFRRLVSIFYRVRVTGDEFVPDSGKALLVSNHVTWGDGVFLGASCPRPIRYVAATDVYRWPWVRWILNAFRVIPISPTRARQAVREVGRSLDEGEIACVFAEGRLSRTGAMNPLQRGFELIARKNDAPVIPVYLDGAWGSLLSYERGRYFWKRPLRVPYPLGVHFGEPIPGKLATRERVRNALLELGRQAVGARPELLNTLAENIRTRIRHTTFEFGGKRVPGNSFYKEAVALTSHWNDTVSGNKIGVALEPGRDAFLVTIGLVLHGKIPVYLPVKNAVALAEEFKLDGLIADALDSKSAPNMFIPTGLLRRELGKDSVSTKATEAIGFAVNKCGKWRKVEMPVRQLMANVLQLASTDVLKGTVSTAEGGDLHLAWIRYRYLFYPLLGNRSLVVTDGTPESPEDGLSNYCCEETGVVVTFSVPHPGYLPEDHRFQPGYRDGTLGRLLPGYSLVDQYNVVGPVGIKPFRLPGRIGEGGFLLMNEERREKTNTQSHNG